MTRTRYSLIVDAHGRPVQIERPFAREARPDARRPPSGVQERAQRPPAPLEAPRAPGARLAPVAVVYVRGRRVAWSRTPDWSPLAPAFGPAYDLARLSGLAGVRKSGVFDVVRDLLHTDGVQAVIVHSEGSDRIVHVSRPDQARGGSIRAAWSEDPAWSPFDDGRSPGARQARAQGRAGVEVGLEGLRRALRGL